jgi:hypothetical protein
MLCVYRPFSKSATISTETTRQSRRLSTDERMKEILSRNQKKSVESESSIDMASIGFSLVRFIYRRSMINKSTFF